MTNEELHIAHGKRGIWLVLLFVSIGFSGGFVRSAAAQERSREIAAAQQADVHHARATQLFQEQKFAQAAQELERVYTLEPKPLYLFNIAQAYRRAGIADKALAAYEQFVNIAPGHPLSREASGYAQDMRVLRAEAEAKVQMARRLEAAEQRTAEVSQEKTHMARLLEQERARRPFYKRAWFWGALSGVTAATLAIGLGVGLYLRTPPTEGGFMSIHF